VTGTAVEPDGPREELTEQPQEARVDNETISSHPTKENVDFGPAITFRFTEFKGCHPE